MGPLYQGVGFGYIFHGWNRGWESGGAGQGMGQGMDWTGDGTRHETLEGWDRMGKMKIMKEKKGDNDVVLHRKR